MDSLQSPDHPGLYSWSLLLSSLLWPESDSISKKAVGFSSLCIIFRCLDQYLLMWLFSPHDTPQPKICKRFRSPGIDSNESLPPAYVVWRAGTTCRVIVPAYAGGIDSWAPETVYKFVLWLEISRLSRKVFEKSKTRCFSDLFHIIIL